MTGCDAKDHKPVDCSSETVTEDDLISSSRSEFTDSDALFAYMIEPVTPPKFFTYVLFLHLSLMHFATFSFIDVICY